MQWKQLWISFAKLAKLSNLTGETLITTLLSGLKQLSLIIIHLIRHQRCTAAINLSIISTVTDSTNNAVRRRADRPQLLPLNNPPRREPNKHFGWIHLNSSTENKSRTPPGFTDESLDIHCTSTFQCSWNCAPTETTKVYLPSLLKAAQ